MVPNVHISVLDSKHCHIIVAPDHQNLSTTDLFAPSRFIGLSIDNPKFSFIGSKH